MYKLSLLKLILILIIFPVSLISYSQSDLRRVPVSSLPGDIQNIENISVALRWTDTLGDNVLVVTKKIVKGEDEDRIVYKGRRGIINYPKDSRKKERETIPEVIVPSLNRAKKTTVPSKAYHFIVIKDSVIQTWTVVSNSKICEDEDGSHTKNWSIITDLDKNSIAEIWLIAKSECISDPKHGNMRIIMSEGNSRYTMNGYITDNSALEKNMDTNFLKSSGRFKNYALQLWKEFVSKD